MPTPQKFTAAMLQGKTFYEEVLPDQARMLITFTSTTDVTMSMDQAGGAREVAGTWSIDADGKLALQVGVDHLTITLYSDAATYLDVVADGGTVERLYKTIPFGATLLDRFVVADRDLAGATRVMGVVAFEAGTVVSTDGFGGSSGTWYGNPDGSVTLADKPAERTVVYLRADSSTSSPKSLRMVGRVQDAATSAFLKIADAVLAETPAESGFTQGMVEDAVVLRESTASGNRSIIHYAAGGVREEWYEGAAIVQERVGTWAVTEVGSLVIQPTPSSPLAAAMLVEAGQTHWDLLFNDGAVINPASVTTTVAATAAGWPGTWASVERLLDGTLSSPGTIVLNADGTGTDPASQPFTWGIQGDGSILVSWPGGYAITYRQLATSVPPNHFDLAGIERTSGVCTGTIVLTMTR